MCVVATATAFERDFTALLSSQEDTATGEVNVQLVYELSNLKKLW